MHKLITTLSISALFLSPLPALAETITINAATDTYVDAANPYTNYGAGEILALTFSSALQRSRTLVRFDLSSIPAGATIESAILDFLMTSASGGTVQVGLYPISQNWLEGSVTWNTPPTTAELFANVLLSIQPASAHWDISNLVRNWFGGTTANYGLLMLPQEQGSAYTRILSSREGSRAPQLQITYTPAPTPPPAPPPVAAPPPPPPPPSDDKGGDTACAPDINPGDVFKAPTLVAVYYCGTLGLRHPFPDETVFKSWGFNFSQVKTRDQTTVLGVRIGNPVRPRPGVKLVQFVTLATDGRSYVITDPRVFALESGGNIRHITSGEVATALYGSTWERSIYAELETNFGRYREGAPVNTAADYNKSPFEYLTIDADTYKG